MKSHILKIFLLLTLSTYSLIIKAQNYEDYLIAARRHIENGNHEKAEAAYNVYKRISGKTDTNIEYLLFNDRSKQSMKMVSYGAFAGKEDIIAYITGYYRSIIKGNYISYFENSDITFFDLKRVDRNAVIQRLDKANRNVNWDYDWATLKITPLLSGAIMAVYSFDYYIHYKTRTDKYRITSEMIISSNRRIKSIRDIETIKVN